MIVYLGTPGRVSPSCAVSSRVGQSCNNGGHGEVVMDMNVSSRCCRQVGLRRGCDFVVVAQRRGKSDYRRFLLGCAHHARRAR
jgi:hypothetical protein